MVRRNSWIQRKPKEKYGREKVSHAGYSFDSKLEAALFDQLKLRERAGEISEIQAQDTIYLTAARIMYKPDFKYLNNATGEHEWAESKGFETTDYRIKRRLWMKYGPGVLHVYKGSASRIHLHETLNPRRTPCSQCGE